LTRPDSTWDAVPIETPARFATSEIVILGRFNPSLLITTAHPHASGIVAHFKHQEKDALVMRHEGKVALVTGAARGIGFSIAERLAREGAAVVMVDRLGEIEASAAKLTGEGLKARAVTTDIGNPETPEALVTDIVASHGRLDILVNNAGVAPKHDGKKALVEHTELAEWMDVLTINLTSVFLLCKASIPVMRSKGWGRIVNMASVAGRAKSDISGSAYCASKAGVIGFSRVLAAEVGEAGICVNSIAPGRIMTPLAAIAGDEVNNGYIKLIPVGRLGLPEDIAAVASFLASDDAAFVTGAVIDVNGGSYMA
jgi:3-oxoacyl-[acyl-carrier protein] reductase